MKRAIATASVILVIVLSAVAVIGGLEMPRFGGRPLVLEGFRHIDANGQVEIDLTDDQYRVHMISTDRQELEITEILRRVATNDDYEVGETTAEGKIRLILAQALYNQPSIIVFLDCQHDTCERIAFLEVLRQSSEILSRLFSIDKSDGYTILGRTDLTLQEAGERQAVQAPYVLAKTSPLPLSNLPDSASNENLPGSLVESLAIVRELWSEPVRTGPTEIKYQPLRVSAVEYLKKMRTGEYSTQCTQFRNLFLSFAATRQGQSAVRAVEMYQFTGPVGDLVPNGHSAAEVYVPELGRWVFVDPWMALMIRNKDGFLSATDLANMTPADRERAQIVRITERSRFLKNSDGIISDEQFEDRFTDVLMNHGYFEYFNHVTTREIELK